MMNNLNRQLLYIYPFHNDCSSSQMHKPEMREMTVVPLSQHNTGDLAVRGRGPIWVRLKMWYTM